jgi:hypothetical protein
MKTTIEFTRINNDANGNPRYVLHFLNFIKLSDENVTEGKYFLACKRAKKLGGKKYRGKNYGGGIVFQSYNIYETEKQINEFMLSV